MGIGFKTFEVYLKNFMQYRIFGGTLDLTDLQYKI